MAVKVQIWVGVVGQDKDLEFILNMTENYWSIMSRTYLNLND